MPRWRWKVSTTCSGSSWRSRPLSTKMQVSRSPIGAVDERRGDGGVDAAGEGADHAAVADLLRGCGRRRRR